MPKWAFDAIAAIAGIAVGAGLVVAVGPTSAEQTCKDELAGVGEEHTALSQQLEQAVTQAASLEGELATREGAPLSWPDNAQEMESEAGFTKVLDEAVGSLENIDRTEVDCTEYPCIAVVRLPAESEGREAFATVETALKERGFADFDVLSGGTTVPVEGVKRPVRVFAFLPPEGSRPKEASRRVGHRINLKVQALMQSAVAGGAQ